MARKQTPLAPGKQPDRHAVFYDAGYTPHWIGHPADVASFFTRRGFVRLDALQAKRWMQKKIEQGAAGSVMVDAMGTIPSSLVPRASSDVLLMRYLRAGGRFVWLGDFPLGSWQGKTGPTRDIHALREVLGIKREAKYVYGYAGRTQVTAAGASWGISRPWPAIRPMPADQVSLPLVTADRGHLAAVWLKNFNAAHPRSGLIAIPGANPSHSAGMLGDVYRLALFAGHGVVLPEAAPARAALSPSAIEVKVFPYQDGHLDRHAYLRSEQPVLRVRVLNHHDHPISGHGVLRMLLGSTALRSWSYRFTIPAHDQAELHLPVSLAPYKVASYTLASTFTVGRKSYSGKSPLWVCPKPDRHGVMIGMLGWSPKIPSRRKHYFQRLQQLGVNIMGVDQFSVPMLDDALRYGINVTARVVAHVGFPRKKEALHRLKADGSAYLNPQEHPVAGIANIQWQKAAALSIGKQVAQFASHPAFDRRVCTSDDFSARTGIDYNPSNVSRFQAKYGYPPPRPQALLQQEAFQSIDHPAGAIPEQTPWLQWMRFLSYDVLGGYNQRVKQAVLDATGGQGKVGPISGAMQIPYTHLWSAQWPPYNFGKHGFNLLYCYNYNHYWLPSLDQVWWYELGRMNNRHMQQWLMPDIMDSRLSYYLSNWYLFMAAGEDGLLYFRYSMSTKVALKALAQVAPMTRRYGKLLVAIHPVPGSVGILMPFENCAFRPRYPIDAAYAFCNLAMAHAEIEPTTPDALAEHMKQYKVIVLYRINYLTDRHLKILESYIRGGGVVLCDSETKVVVPGAIKLGFPLASSSRGKAYGDLSQIKRVKQALEHYVKPWARSKDPHLFLRRFRCDGVAYLWVINLMDHEQDVAHDHWITPDADLNKLEKKAGFGSRQYESSLTVPDGNYQVFNVLEGRKVETEGESGRLRVPVKMGVWQGELLAFYPVTPTSIRMSAPASVKQGDTATINIRVSHGTDLIKADFPIEITVTDPTGHRDRAYSGSALARDGSYQLVIPFARNDEVGQWHVTAAELSSGETATGSIQVAGAVESR